MSRLFLRGEQMKEMYCSKCKKNIIPSGGWVFYKHYCDELIQQGAPPERDSKIKTQTEEIKTYRFEAHNCYCCGENANTIFSHKNSDIYICNGCYYEIWLKLARELKEEKRAKREKLL